MYLETLKNIAKDKKKEKLIYILILCVVLLVSMSYIFSEDKNIEKQVITEDKVEKKDNEIEEKLTNILSKISGLSEVSVMVTYTTDTKISPVYNVKEEIKDNNKTLDKQVVYNEENNKKSVVIESSELPKVEGVIVVAKGIKSIDMKSKIATAVSSVTGIGVYKVQVFEKE
jgi:stage III sporulation protein AG